MDKLILDNLVADLMSVTKRMDNSVNGNPRYYIGQYMFPAMPDEVRRPLGLTKYRGRKMGPGYIVESYSLESDYRFIVQGVERWIEKTQGPKFYSRA